jgi:hypothetical protein
MYEYRVWFHDLKYINTFFLGVKFHIIEILF